MTPLSINEGLIGPLYITGNIKCVTEQLTTSKSAVVIREGCRRKDDRDATKSRGQNATINCPKNTTLVEEMKLVS